MAQTTMPRYALTRRVLLSLPAALLLAPGTPATGQELPEFRLKAAFLYNFAAFTEWPPEVGATLQLCLFGSDPFGAEIDPLNHKKVGERSIVLHRAARLEELKACQIVFVPRQSMAELYAVLDAVRGLPVLTVADASGAVHIGAMLSLTLSNGRITFEANTHAARAARLALSSKLLRLASEVVQ